MTVVHHASFSRSFSAAHRVWNDAGKCRNIHGHNYRVDVDVFAEELNDQNFVVPFDGVKRVIDAFDHTLIVHEKDPLIEVFRSTGLALSVVGGVPSTEFLANLIAVRIREEIGVSGGSASVGSTSVGVSLRETDSIQATGEA